MKARLLRLKQYLMRKRKMLMEPQDEYVSVNKRQEDKLLRREEKAEAAARIEMEIEKELLDRLRQGTYDSVINYNKEAFERLLDEEENREDFDKLEEEEDAELADYVMDEEDEEDEEAEAEAETVRGGRAKNMTRKRERLLLEEEVEREPLQRARLEDLDW